MAKGALAKENIINKILETFEGAFKYDKEIRIPMMENGEEVQIKVALTCAKTNVDRGEDVVIPGASTVKASTTTASATVGKVSTTVAEPTEEEKKNVEDLLIKLGLK